jgi:hypothetical protein
MSVYALKGEVYHIIFDKHPLCPVYYLLPTGSMLTCNKANILFVLFCFLLFCFLLFCFLLLALLVLCRHFLSTLGLLVFNMKVSWLQKSIFENFEIMNVRNWWRHQALSRLQIQNAMTWMVLIEFVLFFVGGIYEDRHCVQTFKILVILRTFSNLLHFSDSAQKSYFYPNFKNLYFFVFLNFCWVLPMLS